LQTFSNRFCRLFSKKSIFEHVFSKSLLLKTTLDPFHNLHGIRTLKERLRDAIDDRKEAWNRFYPTITWGIIIFIQITLIPDDPIAQGEKEIGINTFTRLAPTSRKFA